MLKLALLSLVMTIGVTPPSQVAVHQSTTNCLGPDVYSRNILRSLKELGTSNDPAWVSIRNGSNVPSVADSASVVAVMDSTKCAMATAAFNTKLDTLPVTDVYLFRVGSVFVVSNPNRRPDTEYTAQLVMDSTFNYLGFFLK